VSSVTTMASYPARSARVSRLAATAGSLGQYSWNHRGASPIAWATASSGRDEAVLRISGTPTARAARATASSASAWTMDSTPIGARRTGTGDRRPSSSTVRSRRLMSRRWRGTSRQRRNASRLARIVSPDPAPPAT
jgi:hypothetical protein